MLRLFDLHAQTERLAIRRSDPDGRDKIELRTLQRQPLGEIAAEFLPLEPHWSPDASTVAFGSNDGLLYVHHPEDASPKVVFTNPDLQAGFCEWAADGNRLVFSAYDKARRTPPDIFCLALDSGQVLRLTHDPNAVDRFPHWSPSGQWVAFQRQFLDEPELPRRVYILEVRTGRCFPALNPREVDYEIGRFSWSADSSSLLVTVFQKDRRQLRVVRLEDQSTIWSYESETIQGGAFSPQGERILCVCYEEFLWFAYPEGTLLERLSLASTARVRQYFTGPQVRFDRRENIIYYLGEDSCLYRWPIGGACECVLEDDPQVRPAYTREEYLIPSRDGRLIPVQRFIPPQARSAAILYVHGGPGAAVDPDDPFMLRLLAEGVEFVCAAYRGSCGYGREHEEANRGEYGRADVWDILAAGFDWKERTGGQRPLLIAGYSYGGFLTLLALAQEETPWAGGIGMWIVSDLSHMPLHLRKAFPNDPGQRAAVMIERSPLKQAGRVHVPLLLFHGALDTTATTQDMRTIQASITGQGGNCELVIFEDDTHGLMRHRDEIHSRVMIFLEGVNEGG